MWQWQVHFMLSCKIGAESLFGEIDNRLMPTAFLLGFGLDGNDSRPPICYEPEKMEFLDKEFSNIDEVAKHFSETDPRRNMFYSGGMQGEMNERRKQKNFREAIKYILDNTSLFNDKIHFVAAGVARDGYMVYVVLQLNKVVYSNYQFLHYVDPEEYLERHLSFIGATVSGFLEDCMYRLHLPEAGKERGPERNYDELLRMAAKNFLYTIALVGRSNGFHTIYPASNALSLTMYEGKENTGHLIICRKHHPNLEMSLELASAFKIKEYRKLRKLLELTDEHTGAITDGDFVLGLGKIKSSYDGNKEDVFHIHFRGLHCYDVMHQEQPVLLMRYGLPEQVAQPIGYQKFIADAERVFSNITPEQIANLYVLANAAIETRRGCMLVFIADAEEEAKRLGKQCIAIKPKKLDRESIQALTSIDGALIIDIDGYAHAKGVILDGVVGLEGDASRGSRYNSALTYHEYRGWDKPTMIVVVSEDGMVDVIPDLMPAIRHSEILQFIKTLESLNSDVTFNSQSYHDTMDLLKRRAFYLTQAECDQINILKASLLELHKKKGNTGWIVYDDFTPDPHMNERFYIPET